VIEGKKYRTIVSDPPWPYDTAVSGTVALPKGMLSDGSRRQIGVEQWTYEPMPLADICALPVLDHAESNAHLYLWTTNSFMRQAYDVVEAWGFKPITVITWVKVRKDDPTKPSMKQGWWFRGATEHVIFAQRGKVERRSTDAYPTALMLPRESRHSRKPDDFFGLVEKVSHGPYLEMFARERRPGWDAWGDQAPALIDDEPSSAAIGSSGESEEHDALIRLLKGTP
jgi:N6-adenosine-specific RNA methylase IME4